MIVRPTAPISTTCTTILPRWSDAQPEDPVFDLKMREASASVRKATGWTEKTRGEPARNEKPFKSLDEIKDDAASGILLDEASQIAGDSRSFRCIRRSNRLRRGVSTVSLGHSQRFAPTLIRLGELNAANAAAPPGARHAVPSNLRGRGALRYAILLRASPG